MLTFGIAQLISALLVVTVVRWAGSAEPPPADWKLLQRFNFVKPLRWTGLLLVLLVVTLLIHPFLISYPESQSYVLVGTLLGVMSAGILQLGLTLMTAECAVYEQGLMGLSKVGGRSLMRWQTFQQLAQTRYLDVLHCQGDADVYLPPDLANRAQLDDWLQRFTGVETALLRQCGQLS